MMQQIIMESQQSKDLVENIYYNSNGEFSEFKTIDPFFNFMCARNPVDGKYYYTLMSVGGSPLNRSQFIQKLDISNLKIEQKVHVPRQPEITSSYDEHVKTSINFDSSGNFYFAVEIGENSTGLSDGHNTDLLLYKTSVPGDLNTISLWKTLSGTYSYPKLWISGNNIFLGARGVSNAVPDLFKWTINISNDSGSTWSDYLVMSLPTTKRSYPISIPNKDNDDLVMALGVRNDNTGTYESISVMKSTDGIIWSNWEGTFSKNVSTEGALTYQEIIDNMLIWQVDPANKTINCESGVVKNGEIKVLVSSSIPTGTTQNGQAEQTYDELKVFSYESGWVTKDVSELLPENFTHVWGQQRTVQYNSDNQSDYIYVLNRTNLPTCILKEYKSGDGFLNYSERKLFEGSGNYYYGSHAYNIENDNHLIILTDVQGSRNDFNDSSNIRLLKT